MTLDQWAPIVQPIVVALIPTVGLIGAAIVSGLTARLNRWLDAHGHAQASAIVADASTRLQAAMQNGAGQIALEVEQGSLDLKDVLAVHKRLADIAAGIERKLPDAIATLKPVPGAIYEGVRGKITAALPVPDPAAKAPEAPAPTLPATGFQARAGLVVSWLMRDLGLTRAQAAGLVGNLGQESGLRAIQELHPVGRGGFGWAQWTGPRRDDFEAWCRDKGLSMTDDAANYGFLLFELQGKERTALDVLRAATTVEEATQAVEQHYERAGVVAMSRRQQFAQQAMAA